MVLLVNDNGEGAFEWFSLDCVPEYESNRYFNIQSIDWYFVVDA